MTPTRWRSGGALCVVSAVALALAFAGCGAGENGKDAGQRTAEDSQPAPAGQPGGERRDGGQAGGEAAGDEERIAAAVRAVLSSGDSKRACELFVTDGYVSAAYGGRSGCVQAQRAGGHAESVAVRRLSVDGDRATALVIPRGGPSDGERLTVELIHDRRRWRVSALRSRAPVGP